MYESENRQVNVSSNPEIGTAAESGSHLCKTFEQERIILIPSEFALYCFLKALKIVYSARPRFDGLEKGLRACQSTFQE